MRSNNEANSLGAASLGMAAAFLMVAVLSGCGGAGSGGYSPVISGTTTVLADFAGGVGSLATFDGTANPSATAATLAASNGSVAVTLGAAKAMIGFVSGVPADWTGNRTLLVDVNSTGPILASDILLVTKSGGSYNWCAMPVTQTTNVVASSPTTLAFRLDWTACPTAVKTDVKEFYIQLGSSSGNVINVDNIRMTKDVRVMPLGDSITGSPGCWRKNLLSSLPTGTLIDMVGVHNKASECGGTWDADNAGFGGMHAVTSGSSLGLADAARTDTVFVSNNVTAVPGNLAVWLEQSRPELVMMNLATNSISSNVAPATILAGYDTLIAQMRASNPKMHVIVAQIGKHNPSWCTECPTRAAAFNTALAEWAQCATTVDSPISVIDLATDWNPATMTNDGVHPNDAGDVKMASLWQPVLDAGVAGIDTAGATPPASCTAPTTPTDTADGTAINATTTLLTSFKNGVSSLGVYDSNLVASTSGVLATLTAELPSAYATEGNTTAKVVMTGSAQTDTAFIGGAPAVTDWSNATELKVDMQAGGGVWWVQLMTKSGTGGANTCSIGQANAGAGTTGAAKTATIPLTGWTCNAGQTFTPTAVTQYFLFVQGSSGTYHIDNIRLTIAGAAPVVTPTDLADSATDTAAAKILTSFRNGVSGFSVYQWDASTSWAVTDITGTAGASATLERSASNAYATDGNSSAAVALPSASGSYYAGFTPTVTDWSTYTAIKFDVQTTVDYWWPQVVIFYNNGASNCSVTTGANATTSTTAPATVTIPLSSCAANLSGAAVSSVMIFQSNGYGTAHYDNIRLVPAAAPTATDTADGTISSSGGVTTALLASFRNGVSGFSVFQWDASTSWAVTDIAGTSGASATLEMSASNAYATQGNSSAAVALPSASGSYYAGFTPTVTDWSTYTAIKFDVQTTVDYWWPQVVIFYNNGASNCSVTTGANATTSTTAPATVTIPLSSCAANLTGAAVSRVLILQSNGYGTAHYDNIRLTTN